ncbi:hypothetical protein N7448_007542 [Penicillium atrosanguineum]|uniref:DUF1857 family protein n=1 Tax=Penicillium atrosanguineum TaxID=1132637 RepID=A0A9W9GPG3_9EURO|nr:Protein ssh4 [Penicillium atrosanguineum]KAJ5126763.1 hypothetical protein N7448_007542 [Penicillium atrosanguineum]KAJ5146967.1 hypothetical protein N7526_000319 [Penicillium atrosanguineum]KAJ5314550.1 Protein ssh4 [Penicillium atrosanguineum]KAJ5331721.1 hypothetical protein N7476_001504 [Penicillium atrosanguineum]
MITLNVAYTEPVNCSDPCIPTLTREQIWKGLELKARCPQDFIPSFDNSRVIEERDDGSYILREAHVASDLRESPMAGKWIREECRLYRPIMSHFTLPDGSIIQNALSEGPGQDLYLTFTYQWKLFDIEPKTKEAEMARDDHMKLAVSSVQGTIRALRKLAEEHRL